MVGSIEPTLCDLGIILRRWEHELVVLAQLTLLHDLRLNQVRRVNHYRAVIDADILARVDIYLHESWVLRSLSKALSIKFDALILANEFLYSLEIHLLHSVLL